MMNNIGWCDVTWNPVTGCSPVSEGCVNCYAERMAKRLRGRYGYPVDEPFRVTYHHDKFRQPYMWKMPRRVFVVSMGDLFHKDIPGHYRAQVWTAFMDNPQHTFMVLTKRAERMRYWCTPPSVLPNVWLGVTAENQVRADERIPLLLRTPAVVRFVSVEPMLGPVQMFNGKNPYVAQTPVGIDLCGATVDWVICGGETGPGARPIRPEWVRSLRDQCQEAGVPFWFKGWGGPHGQGWVIDGTLYHGHELDSRVWHERPGEAQ